MKALLLIIASLFGLNFPALAVRRAYMFLSSKAWTSTDYLATFAFILLSGVFSVLLFRKAMAKEG
jgi:hypothetical protein